jgi:hypothetical protein
LRSWNREFGKGYIMDDSKFLTRNSKVLGDLPNYV